MSSSSTISRNLHRAVHLTPALALLAAIAGVSGLLWQGLYTERLLGPAMRGQDLVTLAVLPLLLFSATGTRRGSTRFTIVWLGLVGYLLYTYVGAAFAYRFNPLFLVYLALFSLSLVALVAALAGIDAADIHRSLDPRAPRRSIAAFMGFLVLVLGGSELGQILSAYAHGTAPELIARSDGAGNFVYVLDLGVVVPLAVFTAVALMRRSAWGYLLAGMMLIKAATMGAALLAMTWFSWRAGQTVEVGLTAAYGSMALVSVGLAIWFLRHVAAPPHQRGREAEPAATHRSATLARGAP